MLLNDKIKAFVELGIQMNEALSRAEGEYEGLSKQQINLLLKIKQAGFKNGWFTDVSVRNALSGIISMLKEEELVEWVSNYINEISDLEGGKDVGVIMAGNIPAVGFHDFLCVLISGNKVVAKLSSDDEELMPAIADVLTEIAPDLKNSITFLSAPRKEYDAVIATGSDNSARYFEQYFGKFPNVIRKSRTSVAVLTGNESKEELLALSDDMFTYFGLGCRNVSKILLVGDVDTTPIMDVFCTNVKYLDLSKYQNNLDYNKSIYLINKVPFLDGGSYLLKEDAGLYSPLSVTFFERVESIEKAEEFITKHKDEIQCVVSPLIKGGVAFGDAQKPHVWDYADKVDTLRFLIGLESA